MSAQFPSASAVQELLAAWADGAARVKAIKRFFAN
jgi:hypothetical protein